MVRVHRFARTHRMALLLGFLVFLAVILFATPVHAQPVGGTGAQTCAQWLKAQSGGRMNTASTDYCLPVGRWSQYVGGVESRTETAYGIQAAMTTFNSQINYIQNQSIPTIMLNLMQLCWNITLGVNQFAANFSPIRDLGASVDNLAHSLTVSLTSSGNAILLFMIVLLICSVVGWTVFRVGRGNVVKRAATTVLSVALVLIMGYQAGKSTTSKPAVLSPWWTTQQIDNLASSALNGIDLTRTVKHNPTMMSHTQRFNGGDCSNYLAAMEEDYSKATEKNTAIMNSLNLMWEETMLRAWVTAQYGNPNTGGGVTPHMSANARQAYCHVLEMKAGTHAGVQTDLTNREFTGARVNGKTGSWLFSYDGWIDPLNGSVYNDTKYILNAHPPIRENRVAVFWATCGFDAKSHPYARAGWQRAIGMIDGPNMADIRNGSTQVRVAADSSSDGEGSQTISSVNGPLWKATTRNATQDTTEQRDRRVSQACQAVLSNQAFQSANHKDNLYDAATLGWLFDFPNVDKTFNDSGLNGISDSSARGSGETLYGVKRTIQLMDSGEGRDVSAMWGGLLGSIVNLLVFGLLGLIMLFSKIMLTLMAFFLIIVLLLKAIPIGVMFEDSAKTWLRKVTELSLVGGLYTMVGGLDAAVCNTMATMLQRFTGDASVYVTVVGLSPLIVLLAMAGFAKMMGKGGMFSLRGITEAVGAGTMLSGVRHLGRRARMQGRGLVGRGRHGRSHGHEGVSSHDGNSRLADPQAAESKLNGVLYGDKGSLGKVKAEADGKAENVDADSKTKTGENAEAADAQAGENAGAKDGKAGENGKNGEAARMAAVQAKKKPNMASLAALRHKFAPSHVHTAALKAAKRVKAFNRTPAGKFTKAALATVAAPALLTAGGLAGVSLLGSTLSAASMVAAVSAVGHGMSGAYGLHKQHKSEAAAAVAAARVAPQTAPPVERNIPISMPGRLTSNVSAAEKKILDAEEKAQADVDEAVRNSAEYADMVKNVNTVASNRARSEAQAMGNPGKYDELFERYRQVTPDGTPLSELIAARGEANKQRNDAEARLKPLKEKADKIRQEAMKRAQEARKVAQEAAPKTPQAVPQKAPQTTPGGEGK